MILEAEDRVMGLWKGAMSQGRQAAPGSRKGSETFPFRSSRRRSEVTFPGSRYNCQPEDPKACAPFLCNTLPSQTITMFYGEPRMV